MIRTRTSPKRTACRSSRSRGGTSRSPMPPWVAASTGPAHLPQQCPPPLCHASALPTRLPKHCFREAYDFCRGISLNCGFNVEIVTPQMLCCRSVPVQCATLRLSQADAPNVGVFFIAEWSPSAGLLHFRRHLRCTSAPIDHFPWGAGIVGRRQKQHIRLQAMQPAVSGLWGFL